MRRATGLAIGVLVAAVLVALAPPREPPARSLAFGYASFAGTIELDAEGRSAILLATERGDVTLVPNRFEDVVLWLDGREVEVEGLLLHVAHSPLLWLDAIRVVSAQGERTALRAAPGRQVEI